MSSLPRRLTCAKMVRWPILTTHPAAGTVEVVQLPTGDRLRIRYHGFYTDVLSVDDLGRWIPAAELAQLERDTLIRAA